MCCDNMLILSFAAFYAHKILFSHLFFFFTTIKRYGAERDGRREINLGEISISDLHAMDFSSVAKALSIVPGISHPGNTSLEKRILQQNQAVLLATSQERLMSKLQFFKVMSILMIFHPLFLICKLSPLSSHLSGWKAFS